MEINYTIRPTGIRTNARFRGQTESSKYANFVGESAHDLMLLGKIMDKDEFIFTYAKGQSDYIVDNMAVYYSGENQPVTSNIPTSTFLHTILGPAPLPSLDTWLGATKVSDGVYRIITIGGRPAAPIQGIMNTLNVVEGDIIHIRMHVKPITGTFTKFGIGSQNVNQGEASFSSYDIGTGKYIEHFIECKHKEMINIEIYPRYDDDNGAGVVEISDVSFSYASRDKYNLQPSNTVMKKRINLLEDEIDNIINNM